MKLPYLKDDTLNAFIKKALEEDLGTGSGAGDHSSLASVPAGAASQARLIIKQDGVLAGVEMARAIFRYVDRTLSMEVHKKDGENVNKGDIAFIISGPARSILTAERLALNCMQRMSGIATYTRGLKKLIDGTGARLLDTRKTTPNFRIAEKWAVAIGGGTNHRFGLYDMVMLKDNHIDFGGGIRKTVAATSEYLEENDLDLKIEVETRNLDEVREAISTNQVDTILLDNMTPETMAEAVKIIDGCCLTEASGGITEQNIRAAAESGVNFISVGALTHSAGVLDMSLKAF
ncbi:carboxylating nicotinate-nucleotide diphosphorylase [Roseivirga sp. BDSF3-8]|uniref:carboxylating nicotinate-nucleotide diphosphorylase n=1 Tax=Roseivirga sp. BDSF3-8 TaxID=3241598 RepID=UPI0035318CB9